jgi:hypothetical protein
MVEEGNPPVHVDGKTEQQLISEAEEAGTGKSAPPKAKAK